MGYMTDISKWFAQGMKYVNAETTEKNILEAISVVDIPTALKNNGVIVPCNGVLQNLLYSVYGIDIPSIIPNDILDGNSDRVVPLYAILKAFDTENLTMLDYDGETSLPINDFLYKYYQIDNWDDFIDEIYKGLRQAVYTAQKQNESTILCIDEDTNKMITTLAVALGSNILSIGNIALGEAEGVNIPFDPSNIRNVEEAIYDIMVDKGLISDNIGKANFALSTDIHHIFEDSPLNSDNFFKYFHFSYIQCPTNKAWMACVYFTGEKVSKIQWTGHFQFGSQSWTKCQAYYSAQPLDMNGTPISDYNLCGTWTSMGNNQYNFAPNLNEASIFSGALESRGALFCQRRNADLIVNGNTVHYNEVRYDSTQSSNHYINTSIPANWIHFPADVYGTPSAITSSFWFAFARYLGNNPQWNYAGWNGGWEGLPTTLAYGDEYTDDAESFDVVLNNILLGEQATLNVPNIDPITSSNLEDNDIEVKSGDYSWLTLAITSLWNRAFKAFQSLLNIFDSTHSLKTATIDRINKKLLDKDSYVTDFYPTNAAELLPLWQNKLFRTELHEPTYIGLCTMYYLKYTQLPLFAADMWDLSWWSALFDRDPFETVLTFFALPFSLTESNEYACKKDWLDGKIDSDIICDDDGAVPIMYGKDTHNGKGFMLLSKRAVISFELSEDSAIKLNENFTDYEPYTKASIWLPFLGNRTIDTSLIMNQRLTVEYTISLMTGDFCVRVFSRNPVSSSRKVFDNNLYNANPIVTALNYISAAGADAEAIITSMGEAPILTEYGNMAYPLTVSAKFPNTKEVIASGLQIIAGASSKNVAQMAQGTLGLIESSAGNAVNSTPMSGVDKWLGHNRPYITIYYHQMIDDMSIGTAYDETYGHRSAHGCRIRELPSGYHKFQSVKCDGLRCDAEQQEMIRNILMNEGIYNGVRAKVKVPD